MPDDGAARRDIWVTTVGAGAPAVAIHCALAKHEALLPLAEALEGRTTFFDMPGHGRSGNWDGRTEYQSLITATAAGLCDGPTHLIGHSFGATAALRLAVERPDLVNRLTLIEPVYFAAAKGSDAHHAHAKAFRPFVGAMLSGDESHAAEVFNNLWGDVVWQNLSLRRQTYLTDRIHLIVAGASAIEEDAQEITSSARLGALNIPVTLIRGALSHPVIAAIHAVLHARIPRSTDHVVDGAGHMVPMTHVDAVAAIIRVADQETG